MTDQIKITDTGLEIHSLLVNEPDTVDYYRAREEQELPDELRTAIRIGTLMMDRANVSAQADYLDKRVKEIVVQVEGQSKDVLSNVERAILSTFDPEQADSAISAVRGVIERQLDPLHQAAKWVKDEQAKLDQSFNPANADGYTGRMLATFKEFEARFQGMLDPDAKHSFPSWIENQLGDLLGQKLSKQLAEIRETTTRELQTIREELAKSQSAQETLAEVSESTPLKGATFEEAIAARLERLAAANGDVMVDTTLAIGDVKSSKKGDFTYDFAGKGEQRVAIECKNTPMSSCPQVLASMEKTMANRCAAFGIFLVADEAQLQKQVGSWQVYRDRRLIITHADMLEASLRVARLIIDLDSQAVEGVDVGAIEAQLVTIAGEAGKAKQAKTKLSNIEDAVGALRALEDERKKRIETAIGLIRDELGRASEVAA